MEDETAPDEIRQLAERRASARAARDWATADALRSDIEAAGWRVIDAGTEFSLQPAHPADVIEPTRTLYGAPESIPSRSHEPDHPGACVVVYVAHASDPIADVLAGLQRHVPAATDVIVVAEQTIAVPTEAADEILWTVAPFSPGAALRAALRRALGRVVILLASDQVPSGDIVSPLVAALEDPAIAVVGHRGLTSADLRRFHPAPPGEVTVLGPECLAFRRQDAYVRRPPDEGLYLPGSLAASWSLALRDAGEGAPPRRALAIELPLATRAPAETSAPPAPGTTPAADAPPAPDATRQARRDAYRLASRYGRRSDLAAVPPSITT